MNYRETVLALPEAERLAAALDLLDMLGGDGVAIGGWMQTYGLTRQQASVWHLLNQAAPGIVRREALVLQAFGFEGNSDSHINTVMHWVRRKVPVKIEAVAGIGFRATQRLPVPGFDADAAGRPREGTPWTAEEDAELARMVYTGSRWWAIAEELDRTERAVIDRWHKHIKRRAA